MSISSFNTEVEEFVLKRFIEKALIFVVFDLLLVVIVPVIVDPYNVFHYNDIRNYGVEPNRNYIKTKYILDNPDKFDGFLFGSSRVGSIHVEKIKDHNIYNMIYSVGLPQEHLATLKTFLEGDVNVSVVYMGIDSLSYTIDPLPHFSDPMRCPYQKIASDPNKLFELYFSPSLVVGSIQHLKEKNVGYDVFYEYGWTYDYDIITTMDWTKAAPVIGNDDRLGETLQEIQEIKDLCDEKSIELVIFTNPMFEVTYEASVERDYLEFLNRLAKITNYYNFSGLNDVTVNTDNYIDTSHYNAYVGDMMIDAIINDSVDEGLYNQGFGWYVTAENVNELLALPEMRGISG